MRDTLIPTFNRNPGQCPENAPIAAGPCCRAILFGLSLRENFPLAQRRMNRASKLDFAPGRVGLSQNEVVGLLAFGSTSEYGLEKFAWWMKRGISLA
jgi:hypothetical protein